MALYAEKYWFLNTPICHQGNKKGKSPVRYSAHLVQGMALMWLLSDCGVQGKTCMPHPDLGKHSFWVLEHLTFSIRCPRGRGAYKTSCKEEYR